MNHERNLIKDKVVLLFYQAFERDSWFRYDRYLKRVVRPIYQRFTRRQKVTGFDMWFQLLVKALRQVGCSVHVNDYALAQYHPEYPVGLVGYPQILEHWSLPNPAVIGPGFFDHPQLAPQLMDDQRYRFYLVTCDWMAALFEPFYGAKCIRWHAGIDLAAWPDTSEELKTTDVLIYDKIRWNREYYETELVQPLIAVLKQRGLRFEIIRYRHYDHASYRSALKRSRSMLFLCEHETQGMAYQEALASNVPVIAWDNGYWLDPLRFKFEPTEVPATSVPYFAPSCGKRFRDAEEFESVFTIFWRELEQYQPRDYVSTELSLTNSARTYLRYYTQPVNALT